MQNCLARLQTALENRFRKIVSSLYPVIVQQEADAFSRLDRFCSAASIVLPLLAEPWWRRMDKAGLKIFNACADIHLYARVLDDAIDEGQNCQKKALLAMQEIFCSSIGVLTGLKPGRSKAAFQLIRETTQAASSEQADPEGWARKNHHLLLIPLYLSVKRSFYEKNRRPLSIAIGVLQAVDEMRQGHVNNIDSLCDFVEAGASSAVILQKRGWPHLAWRMLVGCKWLLKEIEKNGNFF